MTFLWQNKTNDNITEVILKKVYLIMRPVDGEEGTQSVWRKILEHDFISLTSTYEQADILKTI